MCRFRSGIILKTRCVVAQGSSDSHTDLLEELGIEDTTQNAMTKFVRAELIPPNDEWWTNPDTWEINIDQDITPDWFEEDKERYITEFRESVKAWWEAHVLVDKKIDELSSGYYRLKRCEVKRTLKEVQLMLDNSTVQEMWDNSTVQEMWGNSTVQNMLNNSTVQLMCGNSTVQLMCGNSTVQEMWDNSTVQEMLDNSTVQEMLDNSTVQNMCGNSIVQNMCGNSLAKDYTNNTIHISSESSLKPMIHENKEGEE